MYFCTNGTNPPWGVRCGPSFMPALSKSNMLAYSVSKKRVDLVLEAKGCNILIDTRFVSPCLLNEKHHVQHDLIYDMIMYNMLMITVTHLKSLSQPVVCYDTQRDPNLTPVLTCAYFWAARNGPCHCVSLLIYILLQKKVAWRKTNL